MTLFETHEERKIQTFSLDERLHPEEVIFVISEIKLKWAGYGSFYFKFYTFYSILVIDNVEGHS